MGSKNAISSSSPSDDSHYSKGNVFKREKSLARPSSLPSSVSPVRAEVPYGDDDDGSNSSSEDGDDERIPQQERRREKEYDAAIAANGAKKSNLIEVGAPTNKESKL